jgi:hypothetical protein
MCRRVLIAWIAAACLIAAGGCAAPLPSTSLPPARYVETVPGFPDLQDYRGEIDCRIRSSGLSQEKVAELASSAQIDFIMLGDRVRRGSAADLGIGGFTSQVLFFPGGSYAVAGGGEIVGVNLQAPIDPNQSPAAIIGAIHDQGGLAIAAEPARFRSSNEYALADAIEVYNQQAAWKSESPAARYARAVFLGTDHFLSDLAAVPAENLAIYDSITRGARVTLVAGMGRAGNLSVMGAKVGTFDQLFRFFTTHLLASERNTAPLLGALARGSAYVSFDYLGYVGSFSFYAQSGDAETLMGGNVPLAAGLKLRAVLPAPADRIVMLYDGAEVASAEDAKEIEFAPTSAGAYRVEALRNGLPWIVSNPIYVR